MQCQNVMAHAPLVTCNPTCASSKCHGTCTACDMQSNLCIVKFSMGAKMVAMGMGAKMVAGSGMPTCIQEYHAMFSQYPAPLPPSLSLSLLGRIAPMQRILVYSSVFFANAHNNACLSAVALKPLVAATRYTAVRVSCGRIVIVLGRGACLTPPLSVTLLLIQSRHGTKTVANTTG
jgi:hypothetical protein